MIRDRSATGPRRRRHRPARPVRALLAALLLAAGAALAQDAPPFGVEPGERAPFFTLVDRSGAAVSNRDFAGEPLVINFWATWCGPCRAELPLFQRVADETGARFLLVNLSEGPDAVARYLDEVGVTLPLARDATAAERGALAADGVEPLPSAAVFNVYRAFGLPTTYFVDADGVIRAVQVGQVLEPILARRLATIGVDWTP